ncbi:hypothetical protein C1H46_002905 [Malus baccata]|uniref:DUF7705 domain-containing protein n=1 Tax=Malus baccata TaxID=106549 RepID=A0A540NLZ3_MALBA|nr:hypothetical protein C1H46_002905 [Malus baccata]
MMMHVSLFLSRLILPLLCIISVLDGAFVSGENDYVSTVGDSGMRRDAWNFCNEVGAEAPDMGSPRAADCFNLTSTSLKHRVSEKDNLLGVGTPFPGISQRALCNVDLYAVEKELYLGSLCQVPDSPKPWQFWMIMLKNGNFDTMAGLCPSNGKKTPPFSDPRRFPCFGKGCMNQPTVVHQKTQLLDGNTTLREAFSGTYDLGSNPSDGLDLISFYQVEWEKKRDAGSWQFRHILKTSKNYPWLMLYLRADATQGYSGGYHYDTRGMLKTPPESPNFKVRLTLDIKKGGGSKSQFYLIDIGGCWKNNGKPCDGDVLTDVTRYTGMANPETAACYPTKQGQGWIGDARTWELDVGGLSSKLHYYQDPGTTSARRIWGSIDVGT